MKLKYCIVLSILFFACNNQSSKIIDIDFSDMETIVIDTKKGTLLPMDSLIEKVEFIKLETTDNNLIGKISQILFTDSLLIIVDNESSKSIYFFDIQGHYKYKIFNRGNGPDEYVEISNVNIVPDKQQLAVLDRRQNKILYYTFEGMYISSERTPFMLDYFEYLESGNKAYNISGMYDSGIEKYKDSSLIVTTSSNDIIYGFSRDLNNQNFTFSKHRSLRKFQENVYFSPNFSDIIFSINDTTVKAKYHIDFANNKMPDLSSKITDKQFEEYCKKYFFFNGDFIELKDFTYINIATPWGYPSAIYSHKQKETFLNSGKGNHPFFTFLDITPQARYKDNIIVIDVAPYIIYAYQQELYKNKKFNAILDALFENLTEDANPVLFLYHLNMNL